MKNKKQNKRQAVMWGNMTTEQKREARALAQALQEKYDLDKVFDALEAQHGTRATATHETLAGHFWRVTIVSYDLGRRAVYFNRRGQEYQADYQDGHLAYWVAA